MLDLALLDAAEARVSFEPKRHLYRMDGRHIPGVTTIIKTLNAPRLNDWHVRQERDACIRAAEKLYFGRLEIMPGRFGEAFAEMIGEEYEGQRIGREAADKGKELHAMIEFYCKSKLNIPCEEPHVSDDTQSRYGSWLTWVRQVDFQPLAVERRIYSAEHWYAGTFDLAALVEGRLVVADWKSSGHYIEQELQSAAYRAALRELGCGEWGGLLVVVPRDGSEVKTVIPHLDVDVGMQGFLACRKLYELQKAFK